VELRNSLNCSYNILSWDLKNTVVTTISGSSGNKTNRGIENQDAIIDSIHSSFRGAFSKNLHIKRKFDFLYRMANKLSIS